MNEPSINVFSNFNNKICGFYDIRRVKVRKNTLTLKQSEGVCAVGNFWKIHFPWETKYPTLSEKFHANKNLQ